MPEWRETTEQIDWRAKQPSQVACFSEARKCCGAWDTTCGHKAKDITQSIAWRREAWKAGALDDLLWKDERRPSSIRRTLEPYQRHRWGNFRETGWSAYGLFRAHIYHAELNWPELGGENYSLIVPELCFVVAVLCCSLNSCVMYHDGVIGSIQMYAYHYS